MGAGNVEFHHISVMLEETVKGLVTNKEGIYVDCTLGGAGHSHRIAELLSSKGRIIGIDQDEEAIEAAKERLKDVKCRVDIVHSNFSHLEEILEAQGAPLVDGVVFDLGVSSHQIDTAERGFSYMHDAPLDMRMDPEAKFSAYDVVNTYSEKELDRIFHDYGEERWGRRIAQFMPPASAARKKLGFPVPVRDWLRQEPYTSRVRAAFARPAAAQFFRPQVLHSMLNRHLHGGDCWRQIWCVYSFLIWYEQFFGA